MIDDEELPTLISNIQQAVLRGQILWKRHALERMLQRGISRDEVKQAILNCVVIETYPDGHPLPSLLLARLQNNPLHVVLAYDVLSSICHIITVYRPDLIHFEADLITRRLS